MTIFTSKIHFYFDTPEHAYMDDAAELQSAVASVKSDYTASAAMSARSGEATDENVYITVQFAADYMETKEYRSLAADLANAKSAEERSLLKTRRNAYSKRYHAALIEENMSLLSDIPYTDAHPIDYSSFVTLTVPATQLDTEALSAIAENENILHISLTDGFEVVSESETDTTLTNSSKTGWHDVLECIGAKSIVQNGTYTGEGIKVGIYEDAFYDFPTTHFNACDTTNPNISPLIENNRWTVRPYINGLSTNDTIVTHATKVTSILALMLPDAEFYFAHLPPSTVGQRIEGIAWFIEQGCDIVNCSIGIGSTGYRYDVDAVYDYQIYTSLITVVKSAGNTTQNPNQYVTSPGYGYNVITVGGVKYSADDGGWIHDDGACYKNPSGIVTPNIAAPFRMRIENVGEVGGTSFAAPLVTACAAMWMEKCIASNQYALTFSNSVMSVLQTTTTRTADFTALSGIAMDDKVGAGIVNLKKLLDVSLTAQIVTNPQGSNGSIILDTTVYFYQYFPAQISLAWFACPLMSNFQEDGVTSGTKYVMDYDVYVYLDGQLIEWSNCSDSAMERIRFSPEYSGNYRIVVKQYGNQLYSA
ncbi:MAG: hypothetical protein E7616_05890, partial [Ruminococcaceae bacterium]|nr:hypothetical protein [Oscillospiraceae bacterium]